jgi:hypothetical protein
VISVARRLWQVIEPIHAVLYFAPELREAAGPSGLAEHGSTYFACRAAPLGRASAGLVAAVFYGFSPSRVARSVPSMWKLIEPAAALELRAAVADAALTRLLGPLATDPSTARAAQLAARAVDAAQVAGRPLAAANAEVAVDGRSLWQALTTLREHRGDGHLSALLIADVGPCESHVLRAGAAVADPQFLQASRGWSVDEWSAASDRLRARGWVGADGALTPAGHAVREGYETETDRLAAGPFDALGADRIEELYASLARVATAVVDAGGVPVERGLGSPWPPA